MPQHNKRWLCIGLGSVSLGKRLVFHRSIREVLHLLFWCFTVFNLTRIYYSNLAKYLAVWVFSHENKRLKITGNFSTWPIRLHLYFFQHCYLDVFLCANDAKITFQSPLPAPRLELPDPIKKYKKKIIQFDYESWMDRNGKNSTMFHHNTKWFFSLGSNVCACHIFDEQSKKLEFFSAHTQPIWIIWPAVDVYTETDTEKICA